MMNMLKKLPGLILIVITAVTAYYLSNYYPLIDSLVAGIILGMVIRLIIGSSPFFLSGTEFFPSLLIPIGLVLYGVNLKFQKVLEVASLTWIVWLQLFVGISVVFWLAGILGRRLKISQGTSILTAVGTAICGASAIIMVAPIIRAKKDDIGRALLTITLFGLIGVFLYPFIQKFFGMPKDIYALFTSTTLSQTGFVKMAASYLGTACKDLALSLKLIRTILIVPVLIILSIIFSKKEDEPIAQDEQDEIKKPFLIYWALAGFITVGLLFSFVPVLAPYAKTIQPYSVFIWTMALVSIGLMIDVRILFKEFPRAAFLGLILWLVAIAVFMFGYWAVTIIG
ncbi:MAG: putative sulfate exporter family transporter [Candidatus Paceibacterota bacterium]